MIDFDETNPEYSLKSDLIVGAAALLIFILSVCI